MALTWLTEVEERGEILSDCASSTYFGEDVMEMEMWKCLLQVDTEVEVTTDPCSLVLSVCVLQQDSPAIFVLSYNFQNFSFTYMFHSSAFILTKLLSNLFPCLFHSLTLKNI
jgi:hypothetical protein